MRPIHKPLVPPGIATYPVHALLLNEFGPYCSFCENRIIDACWGWNTQSRTIATMYAQSGEWDQLLLLCQNCRVAALAAQAVQSDASLLLPDRAHTFSVTGASPFSYDLQPVERVFLNDDGIPLGAPETVERVIVRGATSEARATIDYFALNTRYYDPQANMLRIPRTDYLSLADRRLELRTDTWLVATEQIKLFKIEDDAVSLRSLQNLTGRLIQTCGFWSTWATVLWRAGLERAILARLLMPARSLAAPAASGQAGFYGQAQSFPHTRFDWLD